MNVLDGLFSWINAKVPPDALTRFTSVKNNLTTDKVSTAVKSAATAENAQKIVSSGNLQKAASDIFSNIFTSLSK